MPPKKKKPKNTETVDSYPTLVNYVNVSTQSSDNDSMQMCDYDTTAHSSSAFTQSAHQTVSQKSLTTTTHHNQQQQQHHQHHQRQQTTTIQLAIYSGLSDAEEESMTNLEECSEQFARLQTYCAHSECERAIDDMSAAINCSECDNWYHCVCVSIAPRLQRMFGADHRLKWLCSDCTANNAQNPLIHII